MTDSLRDRVIAMIDVSDIAETRAQENKTMTRPDLDALAALLAKNPHDSADAVTALVALPALLAYASELEQQVQACGIRPRGKSVAPEAYAAALAMREKCAQTADNGNARAVAAAIRGIAP